MRTVRLARVAAEAEVLRLRRMVRRLAIDAALLAVALLFVIAAFALAHAALYLLIAPLQGSLKAVLYLLAGDLVIAVLVGAFVVFLNGPGRIERQAFEVRQAARLQIAESLTTGAMIASVTRAIGPRRAIEMMTAVFQTLGRRSK